MMKLRLLLVLCLAGISAGLSAQSVREVDICVYGGSSAGVIAAYTAKKLNKTVLLIEPGKRLGGLTSGGLGYTDIGNKYAITGISRDFYRRIGKHYGKFEQWIFEPGVAERTFQGYIREAGVEVLYQHRLAGAQKTGGRITGIQLESSTGGAAKHAVIRAKMFIDCTYEGDLMAKAGVSYTVGREANAQYSETYNGVQLRNKHQFPEGVDPYKVPGKPESGLLWGISAEPMAEQGSGDKKVQAYNFRICLSSEPGNMIPITQPEGYDPARYELLLRVVEKTKPGNLWGILKFDLMPNHKTDINNNGAFSTDMIGMNYNYPEADYATREKITKEHELYNKGLLYFIGHDPRMPQHLREAMLKWGYPKDEYQDFGNWSPQMYVREARRMVGAYVMTQANCEGKEVVKDGVGMAAYTMDSHNCQRIVENGMVKNEGDVQIGGFGPYPISYRSIIPKAEDCENLLVPVCLSATHIAYGSIRMEPVFMVLAQSSATAAVAAIDNKTSVQDIDVAKLQRELAARPLASNHTAEILVDNDDAAHVEKKGDWKQEKKGAYGPSFFEAAKGSQQSSVRFTPDVLKAGTYKVYTYVPKVPGLSSSTQITVFDGKKEKKVPYTAASVRVQGQTSGEWVELGSHTLPKGNKAYVEISNTGADGVIVADAVLFIPVEK
ncbi:FAD-dependent oxidoreductase [Chitinophaga sp. YIM B06452]|uniref:FAD-dependent oxidoreductase n=1 Tax=Chitinophaga sp. YIM B06452 TaxID=3082158 RepID=UPI0031FF1056